MNNNQKTGSPGLAAAREEAAHILASHPATAHLSKADAAALARKITSAIRDAYWDGKKEGQDEIKSIYQEPA